jgi:hypothetical protein
MKKKEVIRKYNFSDGKLKQLADTLLELILRDIERFEDRGFGHAKQMAYENAILIFATYSSDEELEGMKVAATEHKNNARTALEKAMRTIFLAARNVFKEGTGRYKEFGNGSLTAQTDEELVRNAQIMETVATKYLYLLQDEGLNNLKLNQLRELKERFDKSINEQRKAISERDITTEARIEAGNTLYDLTVKYADIGKDIWYDSNEAKYNDYIIYNTTTGTKEEEEV